MTNPLRYGLLGAGMMGREHLRNLALFKDVQVVAVCEPNLDMLKKARALAPDAVFVADLTALLDQRLIAGLGNIYVNEALHMSGISPRRRAQTITGKRAEKLVIAIRTVLAAAIEAGGTSLRDHVQPGGEIGYFVQRLLVYGRTSEPCLNCATPIKELRQSGRASFYCPSCQR